MQKIIGVTLALALHVCRQLKRRNEPRLITAEPSVGTRELSPDDHFCILATDGLWDVFSDDEAVQAVEQHRSRFGTLAGAAEMLSRVAIDERQSADNVTVLILVLMWDQEGVSASLSGNEVH
jgi:serine/threonine protein phosphatase PrpC